MASIAASNQARTAGASLPTGASGKELATGSTARAPSSGSISGSVASFIRLSGRPLRVLSLVFHDSPFQATYLRQDNLSQVDLAQAAGQGLEMAIFQKQKLFE
jgi:hypothetical protein